jgi:hypothetical protein
MSDNKVEVVLSQQLPRLSRGISTIAIAFEIIFQRHSSRLNSAKLCRRRYKVTEYLWYRSSYLAATQRVKYFDLLSLKQLRLR